MTDATTISVRGEARQVVPPDYVVIGAGIEIRDRDKQAALERAGAAQSAVIVALRERGGTARTADATDAPLTWSTRSFSAQPDEEWDEHKGRRHVGWRVHLPVSVTLRELARLDDVVAALSAIADLNVYDVQWQVDRRNPAWPLVRAAAIEDAITKARDYATALGGAVSALVHIADEGLLGGQDRHHGLAAARSYSAAVEHAVEAGPSLDPVPQEISAVIEGRFTAHIEIPLP